MRFDGKVALITGGGSGIGRATVAAFAQEGARVAVTDSNRQGAEETAHAIEAAGGQALALEADVTAPAAVEAMTQAVVDAYGQLDCALNAAGVGGEGTPLLELSWERWQRTLSINLSGVFLCVQQQLRHMVPAGRGAICNVASIWGLAGTGTDGMIGERQTAYNASKHGVVGLTKCAALDYWHSEANCRHDRSQRSRSGGLAKFGERHRRDLLAQRKLPVPWVHHVEVIEL